jgi:hypothetical protein
MNSTESFPDCCPQLECDERGYTNWTDSADPSMTVVISKYDGHWFAGMKIFEFKIFDFVFTWEIV